MFIGKGKLQNRSKLRFKAQFAPIGRACLRSKRRINFNNNTQKLLLKVNAFLGNRSDINLTMMSQNLCLCEKQPFEIEVEPNVRMKSL